jgi:hypothetical protein
MRTQFGVLVAVLTIACLGAPLAAHHSFAVEYDIKKPVAITGVVTKVEWTNPHMRVYVDVTDPSGVVTNWNLELGSPNSIVRKGWGKNDLKVGDKVNVKAYGGREILTRACMDTITLADGRSLFVGAAPGTPGAPVEP